MTETSSPVTPSPESPSAEPLIESLRLDLGALSLGRRYERLLVRVVLSRELSPSRLPRLRTAADVYRDFAALTLLDREAFLVLLLDHKNRCVGVTVVSIGSLSASLVHPREVFKAAILANAAAIIVLHNHPSGDPTPSREDRDITSRLKRCGETLGIPLLDHVIVAMDGYRSLAELGLL